MHPRTPATGRTLAAVAALAAASRHVLGLLLLLGSLLAALPAAAGELLLDVLDVGQGDALLLRSPEGKTVLVDAGEGRSDVVGELLARGVTQLDLVVATHAHADHIGGMETVLRAFPVGVYLDNGLPHTSQVYTSLMAAVEELNIHSEQAEAGQRIRFGAEATIEVLWPGKTHLRGTRSDLNANSVVLRVQHGDNCMLLAGDSEEETEVRVELRGLAPCSVLKVAHHGSNYSSTDHFLGKVQPTVALVSVGQDNRFNHPGEETLSRFAQRGIQVYRTDQDGALRVVSDGRTVRVQKGILSVNASAVAPPRAEARQPVSPPVDTHAHRDFVASRKSEVFHVPDCEWAQKIAPANLITYDSYDEAVADGRRPAGCCHPQPDDGSDE